MIPKVIHYCWLSEDPYPEKIKMCIDSWKKYLPEYKFYLWNMSNINISDSLWVLEAFKCKKYAFAADYIRLYALYHYGGIYLDSDVEVLQTFNSLLHLPYFIGFDSNNSIEAAVIGVEPHNVWIKECLDYYANRHFIQQDGKLDVIELPKIMYSLMIKHRSIIPIKVILKEYPDLTDNIYVFIYKYFSPKRHDTGTLQIEDYTYTVHHYSMSWMPFYFRCLVYIKRMLMKLLGVGNVEKIISACFLRKLKKKIVSKNKK